MKKTLVAVMLLFICAVNAQIGVNTSTPNSKSALHLSERKDLNNPAPDYYSGFLIQRYTTAERDANLNNLTKDENGMIIMNTTTQCYDMWLWNISTNSGTWSPICGEKIGQVRFLDCSTIDVVGAYDLDSPVNQQAVSIEIPLFVTELGSYSYSTIINGVIFSAEGNFVNNGPQTVSLTPRSGTPTGPANIYTGIISISPTEANPTSGIDCTVSVRFLSRSSANMKIVNIPGDENTTSLIPGSNYSNTTSYATVGSWLNNATIPGLSTAVSYAGTNSVNIVNVTQTSSGVNLRQLQLALEGASIVWVGASEDYSNGAAQLIREWYEAGNGIVMITADKEAESTIADALGYYIGDGQATNGTVIPGSLPEVLDPANGAPFNVYGFTIGYSGANAGYISSNRGSTFMNSILGSNPTAYADLTGGGVFIFGDKFGSGASNVRENFEDVLFNIFAWSLKNAPVH